MNQDNKSFGFKYIRTPTPYSQADIQKKIRENIKVPEQLS